MQADHRSATLSIAERGMRFGRWWLAFGVALALHVIDEAMTGFLEVYNPSVLAIRARISWIPLPTFTFPVWIAGLTIGITLIFAFYPFAWRGKKWLVRIAIPLAGLMVLNGFGHVAASFYLSRPAPGVFSSPLLITISVLLIFSATRVLKFKTA